MICHYYDVGTRQSFQLWQAPLKCGFGTQRKKVKRLGQSHSAYCIYNTQIFATESYIFQYSSEVITKQKEEIV